MGRGGRAVQYTPLPRLQHQPLKMLKKFAKMDKAGSVITQEIHSNSLMIFNSVFFTGKIIVLQAFFQDTMYSLKSAGRARPLLMLKAAHPPSVELVPRGMLQLFVASSTRTENQVQNHVLGSHA